jgi:hypothetical protein
MVYTFGDNREASRLRRLAEVYEQETRDLLNAAQSEFSSSGSIEAGVVYNTAKRTMARRN